MLDRSSGQPEPGDRGREVAGFAAGTRGRRPEQGQHPAAARAHVPMAPGKRGQPLPRAAFDQQVRPGGQQRFERRPVQHRIGIVPGPVHRIGRLGVAETARGVAGDHRDRRRPHGRPGQHAADHVDHGFEHGAVEGRQREDRGAGDAGLPQRVRRRGQRLPGAGDHGLPGRVDRPDVHARPQVRHDLGARGRDGDHASPWPQGQMADPALQETDGIAEIDDAG
jgi:hypothetical protein